jgi:poly-beta-hydroxybutyrate-responsive repressor
MGARETAEMALYSNQGQPKNFMRPCLLLLLKESPSHGYELLDRLAQFRIRRDHGALYRTLRTLEEEGLVHSDWEPHCGRPDRRRYCVTSDGEMWLDGWAAALQETQRVLAVYLRRYRRLRSPASNSVRWLSRKRPFDDQPDPERDHEPRPEDVRPDPLHQAQASQ